MLFFKTLIAVVGMAHAAGAALSAQDTTRSERERLYDRYLGFTQLVKGGAITPHWMADGNIFWYADGAPDETVIYKVDPEARATTPLFDTERLRGVLAAELGHEPPSRGVPFDRFDFQNGERAVRFTVEERHFVLELDTYALSGAAGPSEAERRRQPQVFRERFPTTGGPIRELPSPDGRWLAREQDHNVWLRSTADDRLVPLTSDGVEHHEWRLAPYATQPAWSGSGRWSPDGSRLAAFKQDTRGVHRIPVTHWLKPEEEVQWVVYPYAGGRLPQTELFVIDVLSGRQIRVETGNQPDQSFHPIHWTADGSELLFLRHDRLLKRLDLMAADPESGRTRVILTEEQDTFIEGLHFMVGAPFLFTPFSDGRRFVWMSERDGWYHLYLYDLTGRLIRRLTTGHFPVDHVITVDEEEGWVYFAAQADPERPYDTHLYRVDLEGRYFAQLTEGKGQHGRNLAKYLSGPLTRDIQFAPSKKFFLDTHSAVDRPPTVELRKADGTLVQIVSAANVDALTELGWRPPEEFVVKAADGETDLYGVLFKPNDFDPNRMYPVIDIMYGGPQVSMVDVTFAGNLYWGGFAQALAQLGFVVLNVDARGTPGRGKAFQDVAYRSIGRHEIPDHVAALLQLADARPYMDLNRVGIHGISYGGYFTARALLLAPDVYHVGVAGLPVMDLIARPGPIEPYMERPRDNPAGYEYASNLSRAGDLEGNLLIITGALDVNAPFAHSMKMVDALNRAGKPYDLVVLPDQNHTLSGAGLRYYLEAVRRYFQRHLEPE